MPPLHCYIVKNPGSEETGRKTFKNRLDQPYLDNKRNTITYNALARIKKRVEYT